MTSEFLVLREWSERMNGALQLLDALEGAGLFEREAWKGNNAVYSKAEINYIKGGKINAENFILYGKTKGRYRNHVVNKKGKLLSCEFYIEEE